jgi:2-polyprenyl-3-methyl-5-hydroxy-6-metoxy-1,4-benzoquinol methylase
MIRIIEQLRGSKVEKMNGCQTIYSRDGKILFQGVWDAKQLFSTLSNEGPNFWAGKRVLDIAANTSGLSLELAYAGASVIALEPDPYNNTIGLSRELVESVARDENLDLTLERAGLFDARNYGDFDAILCLGLIYHFRQPQYILDYLSSIKTTHLFISTQTHPGDSLALYNRRHPGVLPDGFLPDETPLTGWHPTRPLFKKMLNWAGFTDVVSLTDKEYNFPNKQKGLTNSAYFRATQEFQVDPDLAQREYYPR